MVLVGSPPVRGNGSVGGTAEIARDGATVSPIPILGPAFGRSIPIGNAATWSMYDAATDSVFVETQSSECTYESALLEIPANSSTVGPSLSLPCDYEAPTYDPGNGDLYISDNGNDSLEVVSTSPLAVVTNVSLAGAGFLGEATYDPAAGAILVPGAEGLYVVSASTDTYDELIPLPNATTPVYDPVSETVYDGNGSDLTTLSGANLSVLHTFALTSGTGYGLPWIGPTGDVYVSLQDTSDPVVQVYAPLGSLPVANITVGVDPVVPTFDPQDGDLYLTAVLSENVTVVSAATNAVLGHLPVPGGELSTLFDSFNGDLLVAGGSALTLLRGDREVVAISSPPWLNAGSVDPIDGVVYFPPSYFENSPSIAVFDGGGPYFVNFTEQGLPAGTNWGATFGGLTVHTTAGGLTFTSTNGSAAYNITSIAGYRESPGAGTVNVNGTDVAIGLSFTSTAIPTWEIVAIGVAVVVALGLAVIAIRRRPRRRPPPDRSEF